MQGIIEDIGQDEPAEARLTRVSPTVTIFRQRPVRTASENFVETVLKPAGISPSRILDVVDVPLRVTRLTGPIPR